MHSDCKKRRCALLFVAGDLQRYGNLRFQIRIGVHLGDIVFDDNDVYGDGVNLASRIESLGVPGCIFISDKLNFSIKSHSSISTQPVDHFEFKNIDDPIEVFAVTNDGIRVPERSELKG